MNAHAFDPEVARHSVLALAVEVDDQGVGRHSALTIAYLTQTNEPFVRKVLDSEPGMPAKRRAANGRVHPSKKKPPAPPDPVKDWGVHPALAAVPDVTDEEYKKLYDDILVNGLQRPVLVDTDGRVVDGRARLRVCAALDITPTTKTVTEWAWRIALTENLPRLTQRQTAFVLARWPVPPKAAHYDEEKAKQSPLGVKDACELTGVPRRDVEDAKAVLRDAIPEVLNLAEEAKLPLPTARRAARMTAGDQRGVVTRLRLGIGPRRAVNGGPVGKRTPRSLLRDNVVTLSSIERITANLEAVELVVDNAAEGLDPDITSSEAGELLARLVKARRATGRLMNLLRQRMENTA